jgi:CBS domain-containing protein
MLARELAEPYPVVDLDSDAFAAARLLAERRLPGLIVNGDDGRPWTILPGSQVLRFVVPGYVQDDPALARVYDERHADQLFRPLERRSVRELLPREPPELAMLNAHDTAIEVAALMARLRTPLVAVLDRRELIGAITVSRLLSMLLPEDP